jgi:hypothetical protein
MREMEHKDTVTSEVVCPFLGLRYDRDTRYGFPNEGNHCHRERGPRSINLDYQEGVCLTAGYLNCPIYLHSSASVPAGGAKTAKVISRDRANDVVAVRTNESAPSADGKAWTMLDEVDNRPAARAGGGLFSYVWFRLFFGLLLVVGSLSGMLLLLQSADLGGASSGDTFATSTPAGGFIPIVATETPTGTPLPPPTNTPLPTGTPPLTATPSPLPSQSQTATTTGTPTLTPTNTPPPFIPPTNTPLPTWTPTKTNTPIPTFTSTSTPVPPTSTPAPPTNTPIPPTETPISDVPTPTP